MEHVEVKGECDEDMSIAPTYPSPESSSSASITQETLQVQISNQVQNLTCIFLKYLTQNLLK